MRGAVRALQRPPWRRVEGAGQVQLGLPEEEEQRPLPVLAASAGRGVRLRDPRRRQGSLAGSGARVGRTRRQETGRGEGGATDRAPGGRSPRQPPLQDVPRLKREVRGGRAPSPTFQVVDAEGVLPGHGADPRRDWGNEGRRVRSRALVQRLRGPAGYSNVCVQICTKEASLRRVCAVSDDS